MGQEWLIDYEKWRQRPPQDVLNAVSSAGGWERVFKEWKKRNPQQPFDLPRWAHKVRNFFNREPQGLTLLSRDRGLPIRKVLFLYPIAEAFALSGDVYQDEYNVIWFQMGAGGTIFHFKHVNSMQSEAAAQQYIGQVRTPIFKLVSPDHTDGSRETIIRNFRPRKGFKYTDLIGSAPGIAGSDVIGEEGHYEVVVSRIEDDPKWQGSYNYAETAVRGIDLHTKFDIKPHEKDAFYVNPDNRFSDLSSRSFPQLIEAQKHW